MFNAKRRGCLAVLSSHFFANPAVAQAKVPIDDLQIKQFRYWARSSDRAFVGIARSSYVVIGTDAGAELRVDPINLAVYQRFIMVYEIEIVKDLYSRLPRSSERVLVFGIGETSERLQPGEIQYYERWRQRYTNRRTIYFVNAHQSVRQRGTYIPPEDLAVNKHQPYRGLTRYGLRESAAFEEYANVLRGIESMNVSNQD